MKTRGPVAVALIWVVIGIVAVAGMTAGIAVGAAALHTSDVVSELTTQLHDSRVQQDRQGEQLDALKVQAAKNARAARIAVRQNRRLLAYLKANGIEIPTVFGSSRTKRTAATVPKGSAAHSGASPHPRPSSAASPAPTAAPSPTATPGPIGGLCDVLHLTPCPLN